jgi:two-component system, OmpR family, response regulator
MLEVLYVDDDADIRIIAEMSLSLDPDMRVRTAGSGEEASELVRSGAVRPDVILLDVMMPDASGPAVLCALRKLDPCRCAPAIFVTARSREAELSGYLSQGAIGVITKPFEPLSLARKVRGLLALSR